MSQVMITTTRWVLCVCVDSQETTSALHLCQVGNIGDCHSAGILTLQIRCRHSLACVDTRACSESCRLRHPLQHRNERHESTRASCANGSNRAPVLHAVSGSPFTGSLGDKV